MNDSIICRVDDLPMPGARGFEVDGREIVVVRTREGVFAYLNRCPHTGASLNWLPDQFLDREGRYIQCANHDALFRSEEPVGRRLNRLQKRDSGLIFPDFSSHGSHHAPQNHEKSSSLSHSFATIPLNPTGSEDGYCIAGPCGGQSLQGVPIRVDENTIRLIG